MKRPIALLALTLPALSVAMDISAKSAVIIDAGSGKVLWAKDAETPRYPASTTKIMTGLLLLEHCLPDEVITAPKDIEKTKESSMHLKPGEKVPARDMLYALMLRSANDGCVAVAKHISGSVPAFAKLMNERAQQIGCRNTHFNNPNGLNDPFHVTTAYDLALMGREAMKLEPFREVVRTRKYKIARSINRKDEVMVSRNKWLWKDISADGIKTGYTNPAGMCYVGSATRDGYRVITAILKSKHWQKDHQQMLDWTYKNFVKKETVEKGQIVGSAPVKGGTAAEVPVAAAEATYALERTNGTVQKWIEFPQEVTAPITHGQKLGELVLKDSQGFEQRVPVVAQADVAMTTMAAVGKSSRSGTLYLGGALFLGAYLMRNKARRRLNSYARTTARQRI